MKKTLFATTAIVAAFGMGSTAAQAQDASLDVSLGSAFFAGWADQDTPGQAGFHQSDYDFTTDTEFDVRGSVTLDNGIEFGAQIQIEGDAGATNNVDENNIYASGSFGRVELGHQDGAGDTLNYGATNVKAVFFGTYNNGTGSLVNYGFSSAPKLTQFVDSGDATKITYYTPRFAGLRIGVSHAPDGDTDPVGPARTATATTDQWEGGIEYLNSFNGFDVAASVTAATRNASQQNDDDYAISPGFVIGFGGFEFGAGASFGENGGVDQEFYDAGIGYSVGPWSVSLTGAYGEADNPSNAAIATDPTFIEGNAGVNYALGSGVSVFSSGAVGELENSTGGTNDYVSLLSGVAVSF